jgi:hypothetical protein
MYEACTLFNMRGMGASLKTNFTHGTDPQVRTFTCALEKIMLGLALYEIFAQSVKEHWGKWDFTLFEAFTFLNVDLHTFAVDVGKFNVNGIGKGFVPRVRLRT